MATLVALGAIMLTAGCSGSNSQEESSPWAQQPYDQRVESYLGEAESDGASETQISELREAEETGEVTYEAMRIATLRSVDCMIEAGLDAQITEVTSASGLTMPMYRASHTDQMDPDTGWELIRSCEKSETYWLSAAYQQQPRAREMLGEYVQSKEPELRECLEDNGVGTDGEADGWELAMTALDYFGTEEGGFDCLGAVGIDGL